ncbi:acyltransferase [Candidatus Weimeria sp. HCP3S3_B5]|uniref:acyltransferase n=1 Tax=Candidatus Weimeria sp. HCP3S3_B5 TaxID=3438871 RepID=UPI003F89D1BE
MNKNNFHLGWFSKYRNELFGLSMLELIFFHYTENISNAINDGILDPDSTPIVSFLNNFHDYIGSIGVEIFVILSGMGLFYSFEKNHNLGYFYKRRLRRVVIPYLIVAVPFWVISDNAFRADGAIETIKDISFYTFFSDGTNTLWFIGFITAMYLVFPVVYALVGKRGTHDVSNMCILIAILDVTMILIRKYFPEIEENISIAYGRAPDFVIGVFLGKYIQDDKEIRPFNAAIVSVIFILIGIISKVYFELATFERIFTPLFALGVVIVAVSLLQLIRRSSVSMRFLRLVGKYSLEIYMCHIVIRKLMTDKDIPLYIPYVFIMMIAAAVMMSWLLKRLDNAIPS